jgi:hypothetical protein
MQKHLRALAIGWATAAALLTTSSESLAAERLVIRTYDTFGVAPEEMRNARAVAGFILKDAGLQAVWRDCSTGCGDALASGDLLVRIVAAPEAVVAKSLGCAIVDLQQGTGTLATVYADRINDLAAHAGVNAGTLLGRAIAHEIGHLLLGTAGHSTGGLMRAVWADRDLKRDAAADWTFSQDEVARINRGLATRRCMPCSVIAQIPAVWPSETSRQP